MMTLEQCNAAVRGNIQRLCAEKWPESPDKAAALSAAVARVTGKTTGFYTMRNINRAYEKGAGCLLLISKIALALGVPLREVLPQEDQQ